MQNRLAELQGAVQDTQPGQEQPETASPVTAVALDGQTVDIEMPPAASEGMKKFFAEVDNVKSTINYVQEKTKAVAKLQDQAMSAIRPEDSNKTSEDLGATLSDADKRCVTAKKLLASMKQETDELEQKNPSASEVRIRRNMQQTLTQNFVNTVRAFQQAQQQYKNKMQDQVTRRVRIVKPEATSEEIDAVLRSGDTGAIFRAAILQSGTDPVAQAYLDVQDKYQDVLRLEQSVKSLNQMFRDMALLVDRQGEMLNQIDHAVESTQDYVQQGTKQLKGALKARKSLRKKYMCLGLIITVIILVIVLGVIRPF